MGIMPARVKMVVDFPLPERPTKPHELPPGIETLMLRRAGLSPSQAYDAVRLEKTTPPFEGQPGGAEVAISCVITCESSGHPGSPFLAGRCRTA